MEQWRKRLCGETTPAPDTILPGTDYLEIHIALLYVHKPNV
jgi:hypothetical protein